jgi:hypothetical protein
MIICLRRIVLALLLGILHGDLLAHEKHERHGSSAVQSDIVMILAVRSPSCVDAYLAIASLHGPQSLRSHMLNGDRRSVYSKHSPATSRGNRRVSWALPLHLRRKLLWQAPS